MGTKGIVFWWRMCFATGFLFWTCLILLLTGCTTSSGRSYNSRYYYQENIQDWIIAYAVAQANIEILPWQDFRKRVWKMGCNPDVIACTKGLDIVLREGLSPEQCRESLWHELGHWEDAMTGKQNTGHGGEQWGSAMPAGYLDNVLEKMQGFCL